MATDHFTPTRKEIAGFPGYQVGDDGSVRYAWTTCRAGRRLGDKWRPMKLSPSSRGYLRVNLTPLEGGSYRTFRVHRLVLEAFVGPCPDGMECRHLNGVKTDNRLDNLSWGTPGENRDDNRALGAYQRGEDHPMGKLTAADVHAIRSRYETGGVVMRELAAEFAVSVPCISCVVNRRSWKHE